MTVTFKPAKRGQSSKLLVGIAGSSNAGKTYSALELATGIAEEVGKANGRPGRIFGIDTERGRMEHYADFFTFMHGLIDPPFSPQAYIDAIAAAEAEGADVIIVDSFSHEWEGEGGVREWADMLEAGVPKPEVANPQPWKREDWITQPVKSPSNWTDPKLAHRRLVNRMLASSAHIIVCMRAQEKMRVEQVPDLDDRGEPKMWKGKAKTKMVITPASEIPLKQRWVPICEKGFPYEITLSLLMTPEEPGMPIPLRIQRQHEGLVPTDRLLSRDTGRLLARWALGQPMDGALTLDQARADLASAADLDALRTTWARKAMGPFRDQLQPELEARKAELAPTRQPEPAGSDYDGV